LGAEPKQDLAAVYYLRLRVSMAFHRFRARALSLILRSQPSFPSTHAPPVVSVDRLLCSDAAAPSSVSSRPSFAAEDYLVSRCGLTRAQAVKGSKAISHFSSPSQPEAVLAFLSDILGILAADVAALIAKYPSFLSMDLERTVTPRIAELSNLGLSQEEIVRLILLAPNCLHSRFLRRNIEFWLKELGSFDEFLYAIRMNTSLLRSDPDKVILPNVAFLQQYGLNASEMLKVNIYSARLFTLNSKLLQEAVKRVEDLGIKPAARMFRRALVLISQMSKEAVNRRIRFLQMFGFSQDGIREIARKAPVVLGMSDQKIQHNMDFLLKDAGLDLSYIARRPVLLMCSVERRLMPRQWLLKVLQEKALLKGEVDYYSANALSEKIFLQRYVLPYKDVVPGLADGYATKCSGKAANRVVSQER
jgi:mTERF domain-containing protein, mitochondrial